MFFKGLDLNLLVVLDVLLEEKSVTRTARRIYRSQPAVSAMLSRVREYFGDELLIRDGRHIALTPFAASIVGPLKVFLQSASAVAELRPDDTLAELRQVFTISMSDFVASVLLPPLLKHLAIVAPLVKIRTRVSNSSVPKMLDSGDTDFAIFPSSAVPTEFEGLYRRETLLVDEWVCIGDAQTFEDKDALTVEEFSQQPMVGIRFEGDVVPVSERPFEELGIRRNMRAFVPYFSLLPHLVENSDLIAIVHKRSLGHRLDRYHIKPLRLPIEIPPLKLELIWNPRIESSRSYMWMRTVIHDICSALDDDSEAEAHQLS